MGRRRVSVAVNPTKDREDSWKKIFKGLVDMIEDQQRQLESLVKERRSLEKRFQSQKDRWVFDIKFLQDHISLMARNSEIKDMSRFVEDAKANLIISMKKKEAIMNSLKFEEANDERTDLKLLFEEVSKFLCEPKCVTRSISNTKNDEKSALKAERDFAWNQFKKTDVQLQELIKKTRLEVEAANEKVQKLIVDLEQSQSLNMDKNRRISALQDKIAVLDYDSRKKSEEISRLTKELEVFRSGSNGSITPVLRRCMVKSSKQSHSNGMDIVEKEIRCSKRKAIEIEPRLFTSKFKVPKLKT
ncbi:hypothetical protein R6Q59_019585 [Mikania micrantha]|uniref:Uncharacterized protein n=1 Tax=Mikania micrantha TaxID=192012 RepID=A0A5N6PRR5_9ASTR|nr:hypothetical protein E3N88_07519 [Mikania micrantha]